MARNTYTKEQEESDKEKSVEKGSDKEVVMVTEQQLILNALGNIQAGIAEILKAIKEHPTD